MRGYWMSIAIVVGFALVLFLVIRDDVLYKRESAQPPKMTPEELEVLRKKERDQRYRRAFVPQQHQEKAAKLEAKRLAEWKANFPWKPTHDVALKFNPRKHIGGFPRGAPIRMRNHEDLEAANYHLRLKNFFEDEDRFLPQFQQVYEILNEHERGHNPALIPGIFHDLLCYKQTLALLEDWRPREEERNREQLLELYYGSMLGRLSESEWLNMEFLTEEGKEEARQIRDCLIHEVQGTEELPRDTMEYGISGGLDSNSPEAQGLLSGEEEMLVPYEGWYEKAPEFYANQRYQFKRSMEEGDLSLKALMPELFPPVSIRNGVLVDKDGHPIKHDESANYRIINHQHESFLMPINEDGTIRWPTPEEMEPMRAKGSVRQDLSPLLGAAVDIGKAIGCQHNLRQTIRPQKNNPSKE